MNKPENFKIDFTDSESQIGRELLPKYPEFRPNWEGLRSRIAYEENSFAAEKARNSKNSWWFQLIGGLAINFALMAFIVLGSYYARPECDNLLVEQKKLVQTTVAKFARLSQIIKGENG